VTRSVASLADCELTDLLKDRGLTGSPARYERWRHAGLLPAHDRRGAGRGRGSTSVLNAETVEIAAALARHTVQGRDLRLSVIAWFLEVSTEGKWTPEPPGHAVAPALAWAARFNAEQYWISQRVRAAVIAGRTEARKVSRPAVGLDLAAVRDALLADSSKHPIFRLRVTGMRAADSSLDAFAESFAGLLARAALFPFLTSQQWRDAISDAQAGTRVGPFTALARHDPVMMLNDAGIQQLRRARQTALNLAYFGETLSRRRLFRDPQDTAEWRARLGMLRVGPSLRYVARLMMLPHDAAVVIAACLDPAYSSLEKLLYEQHSQIAKGRYETSLQPTDGGRDPQAYLAVWRTAAPPLWPYPGVAGRRIGSSYRKRPRPHDN
jgi:hypothetical protein